MGHNQQTQHQTLHPLQIQRNLQSDDCDVSVPPSSMLSSPSQSSSLLIPSPSTSSQSTPSQEVCP